MNQQLVKRNPALPADPQERKLALAVRLNELQLSSQACSIVMARVAGTPIATADEEQLESMWNQIINLLKIQVEEGDEDRFDAELLDLNDWIRREYGKQGLTCEELCLAYNALVKEELTRENKTLEAYPKLDPKHVGEVISAYRRNAYSGEVTRVISRGLYVPEPAELTEAEVDDQMEIGLMQAINTLKQGVLYFDLGNGLYSWLYKKGRIRPSDQEWEEALRLAQKNVREDLTAQKEIAGQFREFRPSGRKRQKGECHSGFEGIRAKIGDRLKNAMNETGDWKQRVRSEAFQICLTNWLMQKAGVTERPTKLLPTTPSLKPPESPKAFSHAQWIESLKEQLPSMDDERLSDLQRDARKRNVLDVYELTTEEWTRRQSAKTSKK